MDFCFEYVGILVVLFQFLDEKTYPGEKGVEVMN